MMREYSHHWLKPRFMNFRASPGPRSTVRARGLGARARRKRESGTGLAALKRTPVREGTARRQGLTPAPARHPLGLLPRPAERNWLAGHPAPPSTSEGAAASAACRTRLDSPSASFFWSTQRSSSCLRPHAPFCAGVDGAKGGQQNPGACGSLGMGRLGREATCRSGGEGGRQKRPPAVVQARLC